MDCDTGYSLINPWLARCLGWTVEAAAGPKGMQIKDGQIMGTCTKKGYLDGNPTDDEFQMRNSIEDFKRCL